MNLSTKFLTRGRPINATMRGQILGLKGEMKIHADTHNEHNRILMMAKRIGVKVKSRKVDGKGYRIWRTA